MALVDAQGNAIASYSYDAFGQLTSFSENFGGATTWTNPYRYDGKDSVRYDGETGLYWMSVRAYDPALGRFLSRDPLNRAPLFFSDQPYGYAGNNPLINVDPSGQRHVATETSVVLYTPRSTIERILGQRGRPPKHTKKCQGWTCDVKDWGTFIKGIVKIVAAVGVLTAAIVGLIQSAGWLKGASFLASALAKGAFQIAARAVQFGAGALASLLRSGLSDLVNSFKHPNLGLRVILDLFQLAFDVVALVVTLLVGVNAVLARGAKTLNFFQKFRLILNKIGQNKVSGVFGLARDTLAQCLVGFIGGGLALDADWQTFQSDYRQWQKSQ